jgi:hypothetical protein
MLGPFQGGLARPKDDGHACIHSVMHCYCTQRPSPVSCRYTQAVARVLDANASLAILGQFTVRTFGPLHCHMTVGMQVRHGKP